MKPRNPRPRTPRSALLFIAQEVSSVLKDPPAASYVDLLRALVRIERLAQEALYPNENFTPSESQR